MFAGNGFSGSLSTGKNNKEGGDQEVVATVKESEEVVEEESHTTPRSIVAEVNRRIERIVNAYYGNSNSGRIELPNCNSTPKKKTLK